MAFSVPLRPLAGLLAALALASCGGGGGSSSSSGGAAAPALPPVSVTALTFITSPTGLSAITHMNDALVVGDHAVVRSDSASAGDNLHPGTRFTLLDAQGKATASIDYGYKLVADYNGGWSMLPLPNGAGFALLQQSGGSKLFTFDAQAQQTGAQAGINLYDLPSGAADSPSISATSVVADGNGLWVATTIKYPQANPQSSVTVLYKLVLTKFDYNGKALTPTAPIYTSTKPILSSLAASAGAVAIVWGDGGSSSLAYWAQGGGGPIQKTVNASISQVSLIPVALNDSGQLGLLWGGNGQANGNLMGVKLNASGDPILAAGVTDWSGENLSGKWSADYTRVGLTPGVSHANGRLMVTDAVDDKSPGDFILAADYVLGSGPLSADAWVVGGVRRLTTLKPLSGTNAYLCQLVFGDHTLLLLGEDDHLAGGVVTRQ